VRRLVVRAMARCWPCRRWPAVRCCWRADIAARTVIAPQELPVGVLTAVFGGGYLLWLLRQRMGR